MARQKPSNQDSPPAARNLETCVAKIFGRPSVHDTLCDTCECVAPQSLIQSCRRRDKTAATTPFPSRPSTRHASPAATMRFVSLLVLAARLFSLASAVTQTSPDTAVPSPNGLIVPFATLPGCASLCGHLWDVQGACTPPHLTAISQTCFCSDTRLTSILQGDAGVLAACGATSCQDSASQQAIENWYGGYCNEAVAKPTGTTTGSVPTSTASSTPGNKTWYVSLLFFFAIRRAMIYTNMQRIGLRDITDGSSSQLWS